LRRDRRHPEVARRSDDDVPARERRIPESDARRFDARKAASMGDCSRPILQLPADRDELARLAFAGAEVPVVEQQHREARFG